MILVEPDGSARGYAVDELAFPNGTVITEDGATLIVGESYGSRLTAFTITADGALADRRLFANSAAQYRTASASTPKRSGWRARSPDGACAYAGGEVLDEIKGHQRLRIRVHARR